MRLDFAMLADFAQALDGKLYIQGGGLTRVTAPSLPWLQPLAVALRFVPEPDEYVTRSWDFRLTITDPDDTQLTEHITSVELHRPDVKIAEGEQPSILLALMVNGVTFQAYGPHRLEMRLDATEVALTFAVAPPGS